MEIIVEDISSYVKDLSKAPQALAMIRDVCRARPSGYQFMPRYRQGRWDGYISLMHTSTRFPTGLLWMVAKRLEDAGYHLTYDVKSQFIEYDPNTIQPEMLNGVVLRDYQIDAIKTLLERKRGIAKMATNAGKTEVMAGVIKALGIPRTLVIVNRKELLHQTAERFMTRLSIPVGKIGDGLMYIEDVTVAMIQTLHNKIDKIQNNKLLMLDESHHASSDQMLNSVNVLAGAYRFGFSGTPLKNDVLSDLKLMSATGRIVVDVTNSQLIDQGYSATPIVNIHTITNDADDLYAADYQLAYKEMIVCNEYRNITISRLAKESDGVVLIIVNQIQHGKLLQELIAESVFVNGSDASDYRKSILDTMRASKHGIFIASPIFDEGVDVPAIDTVILACGGKSHIKLLQRIGRGLRAKANGNKLIVHDFIDDTNKHLLSHSERRIDTYVQEGFKTILDR